VYKIGSSIRQTTPIYEVVFPLPIVFYCYGAHPNPSTTPDNTPFAMSAVPTVNVSMADEILNYIMHIAGKKDFPPW